MQITTLTSYTPQDLADMTALMTVLDPQCIFNEAKLQAVVSNPQSHLYVVRDDRNRIVGCCTMAVFHSPTGKKASLEDVAMLPECQGRHLGRLLVEHAIEQMRQEAPIHIQLTSRPARVAANGLYKAVGFKQKETNVYTLDL